MPMLYQGISHVHIVISCAASFSKLWNVMRMGSVNCCCLFYLSCHFNELRSIDPFSHCHHVLPRFIWTSRSTRAPSYRWWWSAWSTGLPRRERTKRRAWQFRAGFARSPWTSGIPRFPGSTRSTWTSRLFHRTRLCCWTAWTSWRTGRQRVPRRDGPERCEMVESHFTIAKYLN